MEIIIDGVQVVSIEEAIESLHTSRATLYKWIGEGSIKTVKTSDRTYIPVSEIERLKEGAGGYEPVKT